MKDPLHHLAGCVAVLALIVACVYFDPATDRHERVDELALGPWVVQKLDDGVPVYLTLESVRDVLRQSWTTLPEDAWKYASRGSAEADAARLDAVARPLKVVVAEVLR